MDELTDFEKMVEGSHRMAAFLMALYLAFVDEGFRENEAMQLTITYIEKVLAPIGKGPKPDEE